MSGMIAPTANSANEDPAASHGDGFSSGCTPSSWTRWKFRALASSRWISSDALAAVSGERPISVKMATSSATSASGCRRNDFFSTTTSDSICSFAVVTDVYSPSAIENAPASSPATPLITTVSALAVAATPAIRAVLLTRPSMAPKVAARNHPPVTSACRWLPTWGSPVGDSGASLDSVMRQSCACALRPNY
ncbi:hypothetical protein MDUV_07510 [Mycolicibacterium duvalii]|uniref:Uncharacterized protein n=1 Tax=Mycolicibacterium duvalii TaxID=39688 RepID=A0A7I7JXH3_9MYCO|nr:hypothetical protein MDUV_07510 [Mycolicibacterium duvalii]